MTRAYALLKERGYLASRQGSGSVAQLPHGPRRPQRHAAQPRRPPRAESIDLTCAAPLAPPGVAAAYERAVERAARRTCRHRLLPLRAPALREAIARRYDERGLPTDPGADPGDLGALSALAVATRAFVGPGDRVLMESPTYPNAIATLRRSGARIAGADIEPDRLGRRRILAAVRQVRPRLAYLMPDFHNPTGAADGRRAAGRARRRAAPRPRRWRSSTRRWPRWPSTT